MDRFVLVIDDEPIGPDHQLVTDLEGVGIGAELVHPRDLTDAQVQRASVIAIDHFLQTWSERDDAATGLQVRDGMALASVLRSYMGELTRPAEVRPNLAYVVRTSKLDELRGTLPRLMSQHVLAGYHGLDWLQAKGETPGTPPEHERLAGLARAVAALPREWTQLVPAESDDVANWLGLAAKGFRAAAGLQIEEAHPTAHRLAEQTSGSGFLRWFLQRVLPYPTFLIGDVRAALALGLSVPALDALLAATSELGVLTNAAQYDGELATFSGRRWWRAGLQEVLLRAHANPPELEDALSAADLEVSAAREGGHGEVIVLDAELEPKDEPVPIEDAVRLQPDGWPGFAEEAWVAVIDAQANPDLAAAVVTADRWRIEDV